MGQRVEGVHGNGWEVVCRKTVRAGRLRSQGTTRHAETNRAGPVELLAKVGGLR